MKNMKSHLTKHARRYLATALAIAVAVGSQVLPASAAITAVEVKLSNQNLNNASTEYGFKFTPSVATSIQEIWIQFSTTNGGSTKPTGMNTASPTLVTAPSFGTGWSVSGDANGLVKITAGSPQTVTAVEQTLKIGGITNSSSANQYYARVTSYSDAGSSAIENGDGAYLNQNSSVTVTAAVNEYLAFSLSTTAVNLGTLTPGTVASGTGDFTITTNGQSGYVVSAQGTSLTAGALNFPFVSDGTVTASTSASEYGLAVAGQTNITCGAGGVTCASGDFGIASQTSLVSKTGVSNTAGDTARVTYKANSSNIQGAGDYQSVVNYVASAKF